MFVRAEVLLLLDGADALPAATECLGLADAAAVATARRGRDDAVADVAAARLDCGAAAFVAAARRVLVGRATALALARWACSDPLRLVRAERRSDDDDAGAAGWEGTEAELSYKTSTSPGET